MRGYSEDGIYTYKGMPYGTDGRRVDRDAFFLGVDPGHMDED